MGTLWAFRDYGTSPPFVVFGDAAFFLGNECWQTTPIEQFFVNPSRYQCITDEREVRNLACDVMRLVRDKADAEEAKLQASIRELEAANAALVAGCDRLREALEWFASDEAYSCTEYHNASGQYQPPVIDGQKRAIAALAPKEPQ